MVEKYPDRVAAVEWARSVGGGRRLVGGDWIFTDQQLDRLHSDYDALAARLAGAERDAARYRWLRLALSDQTSKGKSHWFCSITRGRPDELDAAIDAAREQEDKP